MVNKIFLIMQYMVLLNVKAVVEVVLDFLRLEA